MSPPLSVGLMIMFGSSCSCFRACLKCVGMGMISVIGVSKCSLISSVMLEKNWLRLSFFGGGGIQPDGLWNGWGVNGLPLK